MGIEGVYPSFPFAVYYVDDEGGDYSNKSSNKAPGGGSNGGAADSNSGKWDWKKYLPVVREEDDKRTEIFERALDLINRLPEDDLFGTFSADVARAIDGIGDESYCRQVYIDLDYIKRDQKKMLFAHFKNKSMVPEVFKMLVTSIKGRSSPPPVEGQKAPASEVTVR